MMDIDPPTTGLGRNKSDQSTLADDEFDKGKSGFHKFMADHRRISNEEEVISRKGSGSMQTTSSDNINSTTSGISLNETVASIVQDDHSWDDVRNIIISANLVTSLGVREVCRDYFQLKAEELRSKREEEQASLEDNNITKLRKRLSIF